MTVPGRDGPAATDSIRAVAALDDDLRRSLYAVIRSAGHPVTREEAAGAVGISRKLAAFHLDKLVEAGLLRAHFTPGTGIRKVGRSPKVYELSGTDIAVSIPVRHHDVLAAILLDAVLTEGEHDDARQAALSVATRRGVELGEGERARMRPGRLGVERALTLAEATLTRYGFEPVRRSPGCLCLRNCPFHPLAARAPDLVCGINQAFLAGYLTGLQVPGVDAVLDPTPGQCCVQLRATPRTDPDPPGGPASA